MPVRNLEFQRETLEHIPSIVLAVEASGNVVYMNSYSTEILGYAPEEVVGKRFYEVFTPEIGLEKAQEDLEAIKNGVPNGTKFYNWSRTKAGKRIIIEWRISYIDSKEVENFRFAAFGLEVTKSYFDNLVSDHKGNLAFTLNQCTTPKELLKFTLKSICDFAGIQFGFAYRIASRDMDCEAWYADSFKNLRYLREDFDQLLELAESNFLFEGVEQKQSVWSKDLSILGPMGEIFQGLELDRQLLFPLVFEGNVPYLMHFVYKRNPDVPNYVLKEFLDEIKYLLVSSYERIQDKIEADKAKLDAENAARAKDTFVANISHEIRTPLNAILGHAQLLDREQLSEKSRKGIEIIKSSGDHLLKLINEVLEHSRLDFGEIQVMSGTFNLLELILQVRKLFEIELKRKGLKCKVIYPPSLPEHIEADKNKIRQILINLVSNAIKFTKDGEITITVDLIGEFIKIKVSDTGLGIPKDQIGKIFKQFEKSSSERNKEGIGLGLSISKKLAILLKGSIEVESELGRGSRFTFSIPYQKPKLDHMLQIKEENKKVVNYLSSSSTVPSILLVDDDLASRKMYYEMLDQVGFKVTVSGNGAEAMQIIKTNEFDLLIFDIVMPEINGLNLIEEAKTNKKTSHLPIIVISGEATDQQIDRSQELGGDVFIAKPVSMDRLYSEIQKLTKVEYEYRSNTSGAEKDETALIELINSQLDEEMITTLLEALSDGDLSSLKELKKEYITDPILLKYFNRIINELELGKLEDQLLLALRTKRQLELKAKK